MIPLAALLVLVVLAVVRIRLSVWLPGLERRTHWGWATVLDAAMLGAALVTGVASALQGRQWWLVPAGLLGPAIFARATWESYRFWRFWSEPS